MAKNKPSSDLAGWSEVIQAAAEKSRLMGAQHIDRLANDIDYLVNEATNQLLYVIEHLEYRGKVDRKDIIDALKIALSNIEAQNA